MFKQNIKNLNDIKLEVKQLKTQIIRF